MSKGIRNQTSEAFRWGFDEATDRAICLVREKLGDRVVGGVWRPGDPRERELIQELEQGRPDGPEQWLYSVPTETPP